MRRAVAASLLLAVAMACSGPPAKERQQADQALAAARAAGADRYDADDVNAAESALRTYDTAVTQHDYRQALDAALNARDLAYDAVQQANTRRKALKAQYDRLVPGVQHLVDQETARLAPGASPKLSSRNAQRLRQAVHAATDAMQKAGTLAAGDHYQAALDTLKDAEAALRKDLGQIPPPPGRHGHRPGPAI